MASSFVARGILEAIKALEQVKEVEEAAADVEEAVQIIENIPDIDLGPADDSDSLLDVEQLDDAIDDAWSRPSTQPSAT